MHSNNGEYLMKDVLAIDFETANSQRSACSIGLYHVVNDETVLAEEILIDPQDAFEAHTIRVHGIEPDQVQGAPLFPHVRERIAAQLSPATVVLAHNAAFDVGVIRKNCDRYNLTYPEFKYLCTLKLSQAFFDSLPSCGLSNVAAYLGHVFQHHNALEDARMSAEVYRHVLTELDQRNLTLDSYMAQHRMRWGQLQENDYTAFSSAHRAYSLPILGSNAVPTAISNKTFYIQGELSHFTNRQAEDLINDCGGEVVRKMMTNTNYFVLGKPGFWDSEEKFARRELKVRTAAAEPNCFIEVLTETEFSAMLHNVANARSVQLQNP